MFPAIGNYGIGDEFHGQEFFLEICDESSVPEEDRAAVVVVVGIGREGEDYAVDFRGCDADG